MPSLSLSTQIRSPPALLPVFSLGLPLVVAETAVRFSSPALSVTLVGCVWLPKSAPGLTGSVVWLYTLAGKVARLHVPIVTGLQSGEEIAAVGVGYFFQQRGYRHCQKLDDDIGEYRVRRASW